MDLIEKISKNLSDTGNTWYKPESKSEECECKRLATCRALYKRAGMYTLPEVAKMEDTIAKFAVARQHYAQPAPISFETIEILIGLYEIKENITLDDVQKSAIHQAVNEQLFVLTGGPGTGKTTVIKGIAFVLKECLHTDDILFLSPTGKAARRITESTGEDARTAASALCLYNETATPRKLNNRIVVVDESSMLDTMTAAALFKSLDLSSKLILVGDVEQLPSVGYGAVLRDLIDARIPCVKLTKTFRQASESGLFANIELIKAGLPEGFEKRDDFRVLYAKNVSETVKTVLDEYLDAVFVYGADNVVVLTPYRRKGDACANKINRLLQNAVNPDDGHSPYVSFVSVEEDDYEAEMTFRIGDPVMQLVNTEDACNGDVGKIICIDSATRTIDVDYGCFIKKYHQNELGQLTLAYAMSVHKSQGSEYACVITSCIREDADILSRNAIYTAITRAKKECRVVTNGNFAKKACEKEDGYSRITGLCGKIKQQEWMLSLYADVSAFYAAS